MILVKAFQGLVKETPDYRQVEEIRERLMGGTQTTTELIGVRGRVRGKKTEQANLGKERINGGGNEGKVKRGSR